MTLTPQTMTAEQRAQAAIAAENRPTRASVDTYSDPVLTREGTMTEQEKNPRGDPVTIAEEPSVYAERLDIAPREPYPTGNPYQPSWAEINGFGGPDNGLLVGGPLSSGPQTGVVARRGEINMTGLK